MIGRRNAESAVKDHGFHQIIQQGNGKSGIEQGVGEPVPADVVIPSQQGGTSQSAASQHGLDDISKAR